jgi:methyl-accepting chemotaxis protein
MLFLQLAAVADTVLVRQVPPVRTGFEQLVFVASGLTSILTLLVVLVILLVLLAMRQAAAGLQGKLDEVLTELRPLTQNANAASADLREAAATAKAMVLESRDTVAAANQRVRDTVDDLADRVDELSAMLAKVTRAATRVAGIAGTAIGGIKAGARAFGIGRKKPKKGPRLRDVDERPRLRRRD